MASTLDVREHGCRQHDHMLGAGVAYFSGTFPERYALIKTLPLEDALTVMHETYRAEFERD